MPASRTTVTMSASRTMPASGLMRGNPETADAENRRENSRTAERRLSSGATASSAITSSGQRLRTLKKERARGTESHAETPSAKTKTVRRDAAQPTNLRNSTALRSMRLEAMCRRRQTKRKVDSRNSSRNLSSGSILWAESNQL